MVCPGVMFYSLRFFHILSVCKHRDGYWKERCKQVELRLKANYFGFDVCCEYGEHLWAPVRYVSVPTYTEFLCPELRKLHCSRLTSLRYSRSGYNWGHKNSVLSPPHRFFTLLTLNAPLPRCRILKQSNKFLSCVGVKTRPFLRRRNTNYTHL